MEFADPKLYLKFGKVIVMPKKTLTLTGLTLFVAMTIGGMLYLLPITLEVAPLYGDVASHMTNVGNPP